MVTAHDQEVETVFSATPASPLKRTWLRRSATALAGAVILGATTVAPALAADTLYPEPYQGCYDNNPYEAQVREAGWVSQFEGIGGTGPNSFTCKYLVVAAAEFTWPVPFHATTPMNWAAMCDSQFPGSRLMWAGVGKGSAGSGWVCQP